MKKADCAYSKMTLCIRQSMCSLFVFFNVCVQFVSVSVVMSMYRQYMHTVVFHTRTFPMCVSVCIYIFGFASPSFRNVKNMKPAFTNVSIHLQRFTCRYKVHVLNSATTLCPNPTLLQTKRKP